MSKQRSDAVFFETPANFEAWLEKHHATAAELTVGYFKKSTGIPSITWPESVDEALCFGWIDGIRHRIDEETYCIRFTPRRPNSVWSTVNIERVAALTEENRMRPSGTAAFERRVEAKSSIYAYENQKNKPTTFSGEYAKHLADAPRAQTFFDQQPPSYRRRAVFWVQSAKKEDTRQRRLAKLIESCLNQERQF